MRSVLVLLACLGLGAVVGRADEPVSKDLVPAAERALHGFMVRCPEPVPGHPELYRASFGDVGLPVPAVGHAQWDWGDCTGRAVEAWLYVREMTGDGRFGREVEEGQRATLLWLLNPDKGMPCVPDRSDPAKGIYHYQMWDQGRTLRALVRWWLAEADAARRADLQQRIEKMIAGLSSIAKRGHDAQYGDYAVYPFDNLTGGQPGNDLVIMRGGQLLEPLAMYWAATGDPAVRRFTEEILAGVLSGHEGDSYDEWTKRIFVFGPDGSFASHFHDHVSIALGAARFGTALVQRGEREEGLRHLRWAKLVYDWTLSPANVNVGSTWGWFPENTGMDNTQAREICEICCTADQIELASVLAAAATLDPALAAWDALWDHVERYTLNTILPAQFAITPRYRELVSQAAAGALRNGYVEFELDANGCYNHEAFGHQTLRTATAGHLSQTTYGVQCDGQRAWFSYASGQAPQAHGFVTEAPTRGADGVLSGAVRTEDGALRLASETSCGNGPYVVRQFRLTNTGAATLQHVRFATSGNLDFSDYTANEGVAAPEVGRAAVRSRTEPGALGMAGEPGPAFVDLSDAVVQMEALPTFDWTAPRQQFTGNVAVELGWELGPLAPGEEKTVTVTYAAADDVEALARALRHETFPWRPVPEAGSFALAAAERLEGAWVAAFPPNDLAAMQSGLPYMNMMGCCHPAGVRGLYTCWEAALADDGETLRARLPITRRGEAAEQVVTEGSRFVQQQIRLRAARRLLLRIPDWADVNRVRATGLGGQSVPFTTEGRWLNLGGQRRGTEVLITYPLRSRTTRERVGGSGASLGFAPAAEKRTFTARWRGNRVVGLEPAGKLLPIWP